MREFELSFDAAEEMKRAHAFVAFGGAYEGASSEVADKVSKIVRSVMTRMHAEIDRSIKFYQCTLAASQFKANAAAIRIGFRVSLIQADRLIQIAHCLL